MSLLGNYIRQMPDEEGLGHVVLTAHHLFTNPAATNYCKFTLPFDAMLVAAQATAAVAGSVSGATQITIDNTTQTQNDLDGGQLDMAYNDADLLTSSDILSGMVAYRGRRGDVYTTTIDAVDGGGTVQDLEITLIFVSI